MINTNFTLWLSFSKKLIFLPTEIQSLQPMLLQ